MRLFLAIELDEQMKNALIRVQEELKAAGVRGNSTPKENLHLTLAFIGEYQDPDLITQVLSAIPMKPFILKLSGIGSFGDLIWAGIEESEELNFYVKRIRRALSDAGVPFDRKRFSAHITLIRRASMKPNAPVPALPAPQGQMTAEGISLMRSERGRQGMLYTQLAFHRWED